MRIVLVLEDRSTAELVEAALAAVGLYHWELRDLGERYPVHVVHPIPKFLRREHAERNRG